MDLDGFKHVNDAYGHAMGDELLRQIAHRMRCALREGDVAARLGGDEFAVLQMPVREREAAVRLAERLIAEVSVPYCIEGWSIGINVSVGIALAPECGDGEALLRAADEASYEAKRAGKGLYRLASPTRHWPLTT